ncbi:MAG: sugar phosphate isomerase/epimerase [Spirochaetales bacterium]|nr:sugar phosphate isomerase/epimerase [Spirochaetales bacterium]
MKLCYQVSTPEVYRAPGVTSYQGDFRESLDALVACGYDDVELMVRDPRQLNFREIETIVRGYPYTVPMICTGEIYGQDKLSFADPNDAIRNEALERVKASIDLAALFGRQINLGRVRGGYLPGIDTKTTYERIFRAICEITAYAEKTNVIVALEPVNTLGLNFINTTLEGLAFVQRVGSPAFRLMVDTAHMYIEDRDIEDSLKQCREYITFVHLADSNRKYPGAGKFDFPSFFKILNEIGYEGDVSVEVFPLPDQDTALKKSYEYIKPLL